MEKKFTNRIALVALVVGLGAFLVQAGAPPGSPQGVITGKAFLGIGGTAVSDLTGNAKFPNSPDAVYYLPYFEWNAGGDIYTPAGAYGDDYGAQIIGYFYPPATGEYVFWICSDDLSDLYLSTDATAANKKLIAQETAWSNARQFDASAGGSSLVAKTTPTFTGTQWPVKDPINGGAKITLTKGTVYYIEALMKEGGGGDNLAVAVSAPDGSIDYTLPAPGAVFSTIDKNSGPASIVTAPASQTVDEGQSVTFSVVADGTPPYTYQWKKGTTDIPGATGSSYTLNRAYRADNGAKFSVVVQGATGAAATSAQATLTVNNDTTPPTLVSAAGSVQFNSITITFSEPLDQASAETLANYSVDNGVTVSSANLASAPGTTGDHKVVLATSAQAEGATLTVTVNNVKDVPGNKIADNSKVSFKTFIFMLGAAIHQKYDGVDNNTGSSPNNLFSDPRYPGAPNRTDIMTMWEYPPNGGTRLAADPTRNYFDCIQGVFIPPANGNYVFFIAGADRWWLYLSTDESPANKVMIAAEPGGWTEPRYWLTTHDTDPARHRSDQSTFNVWPTAPTITLVKGKRYYMEEVHHDPSWCGADDFSATYIMEGATDPADGSAPTLTGAVIGTYLDPNGAVLDITTEPTDATQQENRTAAFTVAAAGSSVYGTTVSYQWQKAPPGSGTFTDIAGANKATYETPTLALADSGAQFRVVCSVPPISKTSAVARLTVVPDTFPPVLTAAGSVKKGTAVELGVSFDESLDPASAGNAANYTLSKGAVTGVRYQKFAHTGGAGFFLVGDTGPFYGADVVLTTSGLAGGDAVTLTVKNVKDVKGNPMSSTGETKSFTVTQKMNWAAVGGNDFLEGASTNPADIVADPNMWVDDVVALSEADFDLISSGTANLNAYDELTFVYEEVTGDFDKVVRVEYQDPMSQWARAGLCATPATDEGVTRAKVEAGYQMERRMLMRVNPVVQWNGVAGNNGNESDWRLTKGGNYGGSGAGNPAYPNAWLRMKRTGQTFACFYSSDGVNWTSYTGTTFTDEPLPSKLLVGPYYSPEMLNNGTGSGVRHSSLTRVRQYGDFKVTAPPGSMTITAAGTAITINWQGDGTLQSTPALGAQWTDIGTTKPYSTTASGSAKYFRVKGL